MIAWLTSVVAFAIAIPIGIWIGAQQIASGNTATLLAGFGGALIGGLISYFTARQTARETRLRDQERSKLAERARAFSCMVTTMQISNGLYTIDVHLRRARNPPPGLQAWQLVQAHAGTTAEGARYDVDSFAPFISAGHADVVHRALLLAERYHSLEAGLSRYSENRIALEEFLLPMSTFSEGTMSTAIPDDQLHAAQYRMNALNRLVAEMASYCQRDLEDSKALLVDMNAAFASYFGNNANFRLEFESTDQADSNPAPSGPDATSS